LPDGDNNTTVEDRLRPNRNNPTPEAETWLNDHHALETAT
jgi:hypothetical protein